MAHKILPSAADIRNALDYNPESGTFTWRWRSDIHPSSAARLEGKPAGTPHARGYVSISYRYNHYLAHVLAWLYMTGEWPPTKLDHRNRDTSDNRWENIRAATGSQNMQNTGKSPRNSSGFKNVYRHGTGKWAASFMIEGETHWLGTFDTREEAHAAYCKAARNAAGEFFNPG